MNVLIWIHDGVLLAACRLKWSSRYPGQARHRGRGRRDRLRWQGERGRLAERLEQEEEKKQEPKQEEITVLRQRQEQEQEQEAEQEEVTVLLAPQEQEEEEEPEQMEVSVPPLPPRQEKKEQESPPTAYNMGGAANARYRLC